MDRRSISRALFGAAAGSALLPGNAPAQTRAAAYLERSQAEKDAKVQPADSSYPPGDLRRYGADPSGQGDSSDAIDAAFSCAHTVFGGGAGCRYKTARPIRLLNFTEFDGQGCTIHVTENVPAITNATRAAVLYPRIQNVTLRADVPISEAALDLVDVNRGSFHRIQIDRGVSGMSWGYGVRLRIGRSTCLWNRFFDMEINTVTAAAVSIEAANCNENIFYALKLLNDEAIPLPVGVSIRGGGDNQFYNCNLEASFSTGGAGNAYGVIMGSTNNRIFGLRTEGMSKSAAFYGINWNGAVGNMVVGHYFLGGVAAYTASPDGNTYLEGGGGTATTVLGGSQTVLGRSASGPRVAGAIGLNTTTNRMQAAAASGDVRDLVVSPALTDQNLNGYKLTNVGLPSSNPGAGSKQFWYDPADGNRVKYQP
jgi:hypothetical protein